MQGEAFLLLLKFFLDELQGTARTAAECISDFKSAALEKSSFLPAIANGTPPQDAYRDARCEFCLSNELASILDGVFAGFGRGGRREERRRLSEGIARAEAVLSAERQEHSRRLTLCRTLTAAGAMGLVILLM